MAAHSQSVRQEAAADLCLRVDGVRQCADDVLAYELVDPRGDTLPSWSPGAHIEVKLADGLVRQYSLCGDPNEPTRWRIAVLREPDSRGGSTFMHGDVHVGDTLSIRGPRNNFRLERAEHYLFIAGGIGITPILPMVRAAADTGIPWTLLYGGRTGRSMAFVDELEQVPGGTCRVVPQDEYGLLDLDDALARCEPGTAVYCCGPEPLIEAVESRCTHWPAGTLHRERFAPPERQSARTDGSFRVRLARSGEQLEVPAGEPLLDVLERAGYPVTNSCRAGICGTCLVDVVGGVPEHLDDVLSDEERSSDEVMLPCVSRSTTEVLVLDL